MYSTFRERCIKPTKKIIFYSLISGTLSFIIANALIEALTLGQASVVVPIANLSFGVGITIALVLGMEKLTWKKFIALIAATLSIFLLAQTS